MSSVGKLISGKGSQVSIIIPTYNESQNILKILKSIGENLLPSVPVSNTTAAIIAGNANLLDI